MAHSQYKLHNCTRTDYSNPMDHRIHCSKGCSNRTGFPKHQSHFASYCSNMDHTYRQSHCQILGCSSCSSRFRPSCSHHNRNRNGSDCTTAVRYRCGPNKCFAHTVSLRLGCSNPRSAWPAQVRLAAQPQWTQLPSGLECHTHRHGPAWFPACFRMPRTTVVLEKEKRWFSSLTGLWMLCVTLDRCLQLYPCLLNTHQS